MKTYAEDRPADTFAFVPASVVDSEGGAVDPQPTLTYTFSSDDESIVKLASDPANPNQLTATYGTAKKLPDGSYAIATVKAESNEITLPDGSTAKDVKSEQVQLVPGAAHGFGAGGGFAFPA